MTQVIPLYNNEGKPLKKVKKDDIPYYKKGEDQYILVPSMFDKKDRVLNFLTDCLSIRYPELDKKFISQEVNSFITENMDKNKLIIDSLIQLKSEMQDDESKKWSNIAYSKAIAAIRKLEIPLLSFEQASHISGIGKGIASTIHNILKEGKLKTIEERLEYTIEKQKLIGIFDKIWGAKKTDIKRWIAAGYKTIEDISNGESGSSKLTSQQKLGLKYYNELLLPIPKSEIEEVANKILKELQDYDPHIQICLCGDYLKYKGDVEHKYNEIEILMTIVDENKKPRGLMKNIAEILETLLIDDYTVTTDKIIGLIKYKKKVYKTTIKYVNYNIWGIGVLFSTSSKEFISSLNKQISPLGYKIDKKGLFKLGGPDDEPELLDTPDVESIFKILGIRYIEPQNR